MVKIALVSCGTEYSGIQKEIEKAANKFGAEIILPEIDLDYIDESYEKFGFSAQSSSLKLMIARAMAIVEGRSRPDAVFIATCFRCAEAALVRNEVRRFIQNNTRIPVVTYSFTERTKADELFIRMEALATTVTRRSILAREKQEGLTLGLDSGSTTTKAVLMENNQVIGTGWTSTKDIMTLMVLELLVTVGLPWVRNSRQNSFKRNCLLMQKVQYILLTVKKAKLPY